jgi:hypothetical protein
MFFLKHMKVFGVGIEREGLAFLKMADGRKTKGEQRPVFSQMTVDKGIRAQDFRMLHDRQDPLPEFHRLYPLSLIQVHEI